MNNSNISKCVAAAKEYVGAYRLGASDDRRRQLRVDVDELAEICRPSYRKHRYRRSDGVTVHASGTYRSIVCNWFDQHGKPIGLGAGRCRNRKAPTRLDAMIDDLSYEMVKAEFEYIRGRRCVDERRRPLPAAAIDRVEDVIQRIESESESESVSQPSAPAELRVPSRGPISYKTTCVEESTAQGVSAKDVAKQRAVAYVRTADFPGLNKLAGWCRCHPSVINKVINDSEPLQAAQARYNRRKAKPVAKRPSHDDPAWAAMVDEALRELIENAPADQRGELNSPEMRQQLLQMEPCNLDALVEGAKEQAAQRRRASMRA